MICPQTKAECSLCVNVESCQLQLVPYEFCDAVTIGSKGEVMADPCVTSFRVQPTPSGWALESVAISETPNPSIAEIERLAGDVSLALSALLAAVRKLEK
jgi:hypothetical protein